MKIVQPANDANLILPVPPSQGGTGTSTVFTQGSVVFAGPSGIYAQDNANLFFDDANNRLGVGTNVPVSMLDITGSGTAGLQVRLRAGVSGNNYIGFATTAGSTRNSIGYDSGVDGITFGDASGVQTVMKQGGLWGFGTNAPTHTLTLGSTSTGIAQYNTVDQTTNYERVRQYWTGNEFFLNTENGGTGTLRALYVGSGTNIGTTYDQSASITASSKIFTTVSTTGITGGAGLIANMGTLQAASGAQNYYGFTPTINQTVTAGANILYVSPFVQASGSGAQLLINAGTNSAANGTGTHTPVFTVSTAGIGFVSNRMGIGSGGTSPFSLLQLSGNNSTGSNYSVRGFGLSAEANTYTSTTSTGTVALTGAYTFGIPTLAASNATTLTKASNVYIDGAPAAGTNVTITSPYALHVGSGVTRHDGDVKLSTAGNGFYVAEGSNATMGTGTLSGGTLVVSTTKVTASSRIFLTDTGGGVLANIGSLYVSARSAGTSFTVSSSNALDTSTFNWIIFEPA